MGELAKTNNILTDKEGLAQFQHLDSKASNHLKLSKMNMTEAFICLNGIRDRALYTFGGYNDWRSYYQDFLDHNGVSRSLGYENLAVTRLAARAGFSDDEIRHYELYTIKPYFEHGGPIKKYDRATGKIQELVPLYDSDGNLVEIPKEGLSVWFGEYVKDRIDANLPPSEVRKQVSQDTQSTEIRFTPFFQEGELKGMSWYYEKGDEWEEGRIMSDAWLSMPLIVRLEMFRLLKVNKEFWTG